MEFKDRIKELRQRNDISALELANKLGKSESAIRMWETGKNKPDADTLIELAKHFECSCDYLLGLSGFVNDEAVNKFGELEGSVIDILKSLDDASREKYYDMSKHILASFLLVRGDDGELIDKDFNGFIDFLGYIAAFYNTRFGMFSPDIFGAVPKDEAGKIGTLIVSAFELKNGMQNLIYEHLSIVEGSQREAQFNIDYDRYGRWIEAQANKSTKD